MTFVFIHGRHAKCANVCPAEQACCHAACFKVNIYTHCRGVGGTQVKRERRKVKLRLGVQRSVDRRFPYTI